MDGRALHVAGSSGSGQCSVHQAALPSSGKAFIPQPQASDSREFVGDLQSTQLCANGWCTIPVEAVGEGWGGPK